jgi:hypothetical protein
MSSTGRGRRSARRASRGAGPAGLGGFLGGWTLKNSRLMALWHRLVHRSIALGEGAQAVSFAQRAADRLIASNWEDKARRPNTARELIVATMLHVHGARSRLGQRTTAHDVAEEVTAANPGRDLLRRIRAAESHPYAVTVAVELLDLEERILALVFYEARVCLGRVQKRRGLSL